MKQESFAQVMDNQGAYVNVDDTELYNYKIQRAHRLEMQKKINTLNTVVEDVKVLEEKMTKIERLLEKILEKI